ncbi:MAG TPA: DUF6438 domain-containing protein [Allosphingosinicella sp.]|jgi:hypothetical protein
MKSFWPLALLLSASSAAGAPARIGFDSQTLLKHRLRGETRVVGRAGDEPTFSGIPVIVSISPEGDVTSARVDRDENDEDADPALALAAARRWKFRPFRYRGTAVAAQGVISIDYRPAPKWRNPTAKLPAIDYSNLEISLARSNCFGDCPDYDVTIRGDGTVEFNNRALPWEEGVERRKFSPGRGVLIPGRHLSRIERPALDSLIEKFRAAHFFGLERKYSARITDNPTYILSFRTGGRAWTVTDYVGDRAGMPAVVTRLEDAIDAAAGTSRWVSGDESTVAALKAEGFDFGSAEAAELAAAAAGWRESPEAVIIGLLDSGVSPDRMMPAEGALPQASLGERLLVAAIGQHRPRLFDWLASRGWLGRVSRERLSTAFAEGAGGCDPAVARALVAAGADPKAGTARTVGSGQIKGASALMSAVTAYGPCRGLPLDALVAELAGLGVDPNAVDSDGRNALYLVEDPDLQERLLALGVRADVHDTMGRSAVFTAWSDRTVLGLLDAGADPRGLFSDGKTLRRERGMPAVSAWLEEHGID